jgi:GST-like protein
MIELYYWPTPNGWKISIMLEECGLDYEVKPINIGCGDQFKPEFLTISPNNRMPAIVDSEAPGGPLSIFESGAILEYLAEKSGQFMPQEPHGRFETLQWLYWQVANLGPMAGQLSHFLNYAQVRVDYAVERYRNEFNRLLGVMERRLVDRNYLAGDYSIADIASWPWVRSHERFEQSLDDFPAVARWFESIAQRPAVQKGIDIGRDWWSSKDIDEEVRKNLFGQTATAVDELAAKAAGGDD